MEVTDIESGHVSDNENIIEKRYMSLIFNGMMDYEIDGEGELGNTYLIMIDTNDGIVKYMIDINSIIHGEDAEDRLYVYFYEPIVGQDIIIQNRFRNQQYINNSVSGTDNVYTIFELFSTPGERWLSVFEPTTKHIRERIYNLSLNHQDNMEIVNIMDKLMNNTFDSTQKDIYGLSLHKIINNNNGRIEMYFSFENINSLHINSELESDIENNIDGIKPKYWPSKEKWPLVNNLKIISVVEKYPPIYASSNRKKKKIKKSKQRKRSKSKSKKKASRRRR